MNTNKPIIKTLATLALIALATIPLTVSAVITGSKHDFKGKGWGSTEICIFCHTPHAATATSSIPLWNRVANNITYTLFYVDAGGSTLNAIPGQPGVATSKSCLSCHDGTIAPDAYAGNTGTAAVLAGVLKIGPDLSNDHPIGFNYTAALATTDGGLTSPNSLISVDAAKTLPLFAGTGKMECSTCHDAHGGVASTKLLRVTNAASALCLACHIK